MSDDEREVEAHDFAPSLTWTRIWLVEALVTSFVDGIDPTVDELRRVQVALAARAQLVRSDLDDPNVADLLADACEFAVRVVETYVRELTDAPS